MISQHGGGTTVRQFLASEMPPGEWRHQLIGGIPLTESGPTQEHRDIEDRLRGILAPAVPSGFLLAEHLVIAPGGQSGLDCFEIDLAVIPDHPGIVTEARPVLAVEVLSPHTERFDTGRKLDVCRGLPGMFEILHVGSDRFDAILYRCGGDQGRFWTTGRAGRGGTITLSSLGLTLALDDLYGFRPVVSAARGSS